MLGTVAIPIKAWVDLKVKKPLRLWSHIIIRLSRGNRQKRPGSPPPFSLSRTALKVGEERDEFSPIEVSLPEEVPEKIFFFYMLLN